MSTLPCPNCGTPPGAGEFCAGCGQRNRHAALRSRELLDDVFEQVVEWRLPWPRTMFDLLWRPGTVALDYVEGRRARYVNPVKYCFIIVAIAFAFAGSPPDADPYLIDLPLNLLALLSIPLQVALLRLCFWSSARTPTEIAVLCMYATAQLLMLILVGGRLVELSGVSEETWEGSLVLPVCAVTIAGSMLAGSVDAIRTFFATSVAYAIGAMLLTSVVTVLLMAEIYHLCLRGELSFIARYALSAGG